MLPREGCGGVDVTIVQREVLKLRKARAAQHSMRELEWGEQGIPGVGG